MEPTVEESSSELWDYLKLISKLETHLSDEAKEFLSTYVSALRKVAGDSLPKSTSEVTMTLYRIAAAHTKLCNRVETIIDDAMVAIMLLEESFACAYQCSLLGIESKGQDVEFIYQLLDGDISDSTRNEYFQALYEKLLLVLQFD
ncbi:hypothetical protein BC833DRAFT_374466 [Globomyces pollinis-pini]|nr:hypothetical protein BC833DRAFT_374466 [Globomyces pollinis-pini]